MLEYPMDWVYISRHYTRCSGVTDKAFPGWVLQYSPRQDRGIFVSRRATFVVIVIDANFTVVFTSGVIAAFPVPTQI